MPFLPAGRWGQLHVPPPLRHRPQRPEPSLRKMPKDWPVTVRRPKPPSRCPRQGVGGGEVGVRTGKVLSRLQAGPLHQGGAAIQACLPPAHRAG